MNLLETNLQYILTSSSNMDALLSYIHSSNCSVLPIKGFYQNKWEDSVMIFNELSKFELNNLANFIMKNFNQDSVIIKYKGDNTAYSYSNNNKKELDYALYNTNAENISYIHNGISFSFIEKPVYTKPINKNDLKVGMTVELLNNNKWLEKTIYDLDKEWKEIYELFIKYDKIRIKLDEKVFS